MCESSISSKLVQTSAHSQQQRWLHWKIAADMVYLAYYDILGLTGLVRLITSCCRLQRVRQKFAPDSSKIMCRKITTQQLNNSLQLIERFELAIGVGQRATDYRIAEKIPAHK
jgi:hypothetical protein